MDRTCLFIVCIVVVFLVTSELTVRATPVKDVHKSKRSLDEDVQLPLRGGGRRNQRQSRVGQLNLHDLGSDGTSGSARRYSVGNMRRQNMRRRDSVRNVRRHGRRRCTTRMRRLGRCITGILQRCLFLLTDRFFHISIPNGRECPNGSIEFILFTSTCIREWARLDGLGNRRRHGPRRCTRYMRTLGRCSR